MTNPKYTLDQFRRAFYLALGSKRRRELHFAYLHHIEGMTFKEIGIAKDLSAQRARMISDTGTRAINRMIELNFKLPDNPSRSFYLNNAQPDPSLTFDQFVRMSFTGIPSVKRFTLMVKDLQHIPADRHRGYTELDHQRQKVLLSRPISEISFEAIKALSALIDEGVTIA